MAITQLEFTTQPSDTEAGSTILPAVRVALKDELGETVVTASNAVTLAIEDNPSGGNLCGTVTRNAVAGVAVFDDLRIDAVGADYTLRASASDEEEIDPLSFGSCTEWVSADQPSLSGFVENDPVGLDPNNHWIDRITGVRHWRRGTIDECPRLKLTGGPNGKPYLDFTGAANRLLVFSNTVETLFSYTGYTMFIVCRPRKNGGTNRFQGLFGIDHVGVSLFNDGSGNRFHHWANSGSESFAGTSSTTIFTLDDWYIVECWFDGARLYIRVNGDAETSVEKAPAFLGQTAGIMHGGEVGFLSERISFNADIGSVSRTAFRESLATKYGIALP